MAESVQAGDVVWDIGANVGHYTLKFLEWAGPNGQVVAFEPSGPACQKLLANIRAHPAGGRCVVHQVALSDFCGESSLTDTNGTLGISTTAHLADRRTGLDLRGAAYVRVMTADAMIADKAMRPPTVTKIDVEGYEEEVCAGGMATFSRPESRHIFAEMHFRRLEERGQANAPSRMVSQLREWEYSVSWVDPSHLHACRR
ncbi:MAG: FkbM family methyltransferase [Verrucomicrobiales bacterium]|nr:FkbM family methyltransferase [Verrucomicrobiales bacterium]